MTLLRFILTFIRLTNFLTDRVLFLTEISVFLSILLISYRDFGILIDLVVYLTEYLGKIDQSLQTGTMLFIICVERLLHIGSHFSLRKWRQRPHFPTKLAAVASFSYKIGGGGLIFLQNWRRRPHFPTKLAAAARIWQHYWRLFWHGLDIGFVISCTLNYQWNFKALSINYYVKIQLGQFIINSFSYYSLRDWMALISLIEYMLCEWVWRLARFQYGG